MAYYEVLKAVKYQSAVLDQDSDKEVIGLRPVHIRIYKRLAGHKDWEVEAPRPQIRKVVRQKVHLPGRGKGSSENRPEVLEEDLEAQYVNGDNEETKGATVG